MAQNEANRYDFVTIANNFESASPAEIISWAFGEFDADTTFACSFEDVALLHMLWRQRPDVEVIFLDTGGHFPETYDFVNELEREWQLNLRRVTPGPEAARIARAAFRVQHTQDLDADRTPVRGLFTSRPNSTCSGGT